MYVSTARPTPTSIYSSRSLINSNPKRQIYGSEGSAVGGAYDDGQYDPTPASASAIDEAGEIYSSLDTNSLTTEDLDAATTNLAEATTSAVDPASVTNAIMSSLSDSSTSSSASATASNTANLASNNNNGGGIHFKITYLIPLFVIVGLVLVFAVGGKIWGRIAYSKERALRRKTRQERQMIREQRKEKKQRAEIIRQQWEQNGWGESMSPDASFEKQHLDGEASESEMDESEDELKGPLSAIGTHLAGVKKGRPLPPARRIEQGRYGAKVEANNWLGVQWRRNFEQDDHRGNYSEPLQMVTPSDVGNQISLRATLRGTWERVKLRITENIGWGYDGNTPDISQRRQIVANASSHNLWTQVPLESNDMPHTRSGLLLPPQLGEDGYPIVMPISSSGRARRSLFPLNGRQREGSYSPPALKAPPNTIKALPTSASKTTLNSVKDIFTSFRGGKSSQSLADAARRGKHERLQSDLDEWEEKCVGNGYVSHSHADGRRCSLDEPQYLPPPMAYANRANEENPFVNDESRLPQAPAPLCYSPKKISASVIRKPSSLGADQIIRARTMSSRKREEEAEGRANAEQPTSIMRNKSNRSMAMSRSSTVRFTDAADSSAASFILNYSSTRTPRTDAGTDDDDDDDDEEEEFASPTRRLSRARTTAGRKKDSEGKEQSARRYRSLAERSAISSSSNGNASDLSPSRSKILSQNDMQRDMQRSQSVKSSRSMTYTESVNFGEERSQEEEMNRKAFIPAVDSRLLTRTRTRKGGLNNLALSEEVAKEREEAAREVEVIDFTRPESATREENPVPALSSASSTESEELESERDMESEIDSALISLIARSNTSKSYYHPFPIVDESPRNQVKGGTPTMGTPLSRKNTWRERNGKWERLTPEEIEAMNNGEEEGESTPGKAFSYTASPPPLPPPPVWGNGAASSSPIRSSSALPSSLAVASRNLSAIMSPDSTYSRPSPLAPSQRGRGDLFIRPPTLYQKSRSLSPVKTNSVLSPSDYGNDGNEDEEQEQAEGEQSSVVGAPTRSNLSSHSTRSQQSGVSSTSSTSTSPQRRTAVAKRGAARPPRRYQAKLEGEDDTEESQSSPRNSRLHTGKSLRTPAEKDRERQFAMDRVQSIVTKGHARRQQSS